MKKQLEWISEYQRSRFLKKHSQAIEKEKDLKKDISPISKTIAVMLDLDGTIDFINDEKASYFIQQLEWIRQRVKADYGTISISTHYGNPKCIESTLDIFARNLSDNIKIGTSFFCGSTYDYFTKEENYQGFGFNSNKVETFIEYYVPNLKSNAEIEFENLWFAIIDDNAYDEVYKKYKNRHPMVLLKPSQINSDESNNCFMRIATKTKGFDGVLETFDKYIDSIKKIKAGTILETQQKMITHLSGYELHAKVRNKDYAFIESYFKEGFADKDDYQNLPSWIEERLENSTLDKTDLASLKRILKLIIQYFQDKKEEKSVAKVYRLEMKIKAQQKVEELKKATI